MLFGFGTRKKQHAESELLAQLPGPQEVRRLVDRERARADRSGGTLAVVTFAPQSAEVLAQLAVYLRQRLRTTDEVGRLDPQCVCAVLPDTPPAGARKVAEDAVAGMLSRFGAVAFAVYGYPEDTTDGGDVRAAALDELFGRPLRGGAQSSFGNERRVIADRD